MAGLIQTVRSTFLSRAGATVVDLGAILALGRLLPSDAFGSFVLFQGVVSLSSFIADIGVTNATTKRLSGHEEPANDLLGTAVAIKFATFAVASLGILVFQPQLNSYIGASVSLLVIPGMASFVFGRFAVRVLHGELNVARGERIDLYRRVMFAVFSLGGVLAGFGVDAAIIGYILSWCGALLATIPLIETSIGEPSWDLARSLLSFGRYDYIASSVGSSLYSWTDTLLIGLFLTPTAVGAYELAWRISAGGLLLSRVIGLSLFPQVSEWEATAAMDQLEDAFPNALLGSLILIFPMILGVAIIGTPLLSTIRPEFAIASTAFVVLSVGRGSQAINAVVIKILYGLNQPVYPAFAAIVFLCANLVLNTVLINWAGLVGAAIATVLAFTLNVGINWWALSREMELRIPASDLAITSGAAVVMGGGLFLLSTLWTVPSTPLIAIYLVLGGAIYGGVLLLTPSFRERIFNTVDIEFT